MTPRELFITAAITTISAASGFAASAFVQTSTSNYLFSGIALSGATLLSALVSGRLFLREQSAAKSRFPPWVEALLFLGVLTCGYLLTVYTNAWHSDGTHALIRIQTTDKYFKADEYIKHGIYESRAEMRSDIDRDLMHYAVGFKFQYTIYFTGILLAVFWWFWKPMVENYHWLQLTRTAAVCWFMFKVPMAILAFIGTL